MEKETQKQSYLEDCTLASGLKEEFYKLPYRIFTSDKVYGFSNVKQYFKFLRLLRKLEINHNTEVDLDDLFEQSSTIYSYGYRYTR